MVLKYSGISELYEIANKKPGPGLLFCFVFFTRFLGEFWYGWCLRTKIVGCRITLLQKVTVFFLSSVQFPTSGTSPKYLWEKPTLPSFHDSLSKIRASQVVLVIKNLPANSGDIEMQVQSLGQEYPLEKGMATHSSILAWRISWIEEPAGLQSVGSQRVGHNWATNTHTHPSFNGSFF